MQYFMSTSIPYNCFQKSGKIKKSKLAQWGLQLIRELGFPQLINTLIIHAATRHVRQPEGSHSSLGIKKAIIYRVLSCYQQR